MIVLMNQNNPVCYMQSKGFLDFVEQCGCLRVYENSWLWGENTR